MGTTELDILCYYNAQQGPYLYQADEGGRIKIMFTQEESHEGHESHHHSHPDNKGAEKITHHEHSQDVGPGGSHEHESHGHTHGGAPNADSGETAGHHSHEKGAHTTEHNVTEHHPA